MDYVLHVIVLMGIFAGLAMSLDLLLGHTGVLSIAHAAFYGIGAYSSALLTVRLGMSFSVGVLVGMTTAILISFIVSLPSLRLHDDYLVIATFGFQMIIFSIFNNWIGLTNGPFGISGIPRPFIFGLPVRSEFGFAILSVGFAGLTYLIVTLIISSPFGRVLRGIREDEILTASLGKNTFWFKVGAFAVSASLAALAGSLFAHYVTYIDPTSFTVMESILVISMVIIGGAGSRYGPLIGATVLVLLPEILRFVGLPQSVAQNLRQLLYGVALVVMIVVRPRGIAGQYGFR